MLLLKYKAGFSLFILLTSPGCYGQNDSLDSRGYSIDEAIAKRTEKLSGLVSAEMNITWINNNKELPVVSGNNQPSYAFYTESKDTVSIILMPVLSPGTGIVIYFFVDKDSAAIYHIASPKGPRYIFKHLPGDKEYASTILVPAAFSKLVLTKAITGSGPIEGYVEYRSNLFYEKSAADDVLRYYHAKGFFKATLQGK